MGDRPPDTTGQYIAGPTSDFGHYVRLDGGEEDTTIRPSRHNLNGIDSINGDGAVAPRKAGGPDLDDWLRRSFDL